ncbi:MAG: aminoacyl-tRNA hydrolase [Candidatus Pacebacteria bacterium]|nr:aminoacyl-tRNA hydrolase [Candidatus Paceibacterota bacterium]
MFYIVGLGNPGAKYQYTRHNIGWLVCDVLLTAFDMPEATPSKKYLGRVSEGTIGEHAISVLYPETFMNKSGDAVKKLVKKGEHNQLIVIYDDVDLPAGDFKISFGNGAGGHNGVTSIIDTLGTKDFVRVRVGVAKKGSETGQAIRPTSEELAQYVLGKISLEENEIYTALYPVVVEAIVSLVTEGKDRAMNKYN